VVQLAERTRLLVYRPDVAANRAANKPMANAKLLGKRQDTGLDIPALWAGQSTHGEVGSHIDEEVGTHDVQPFFRLVKAARQGTRRAPKIGGQLSEAMCDGTTTNDQKLSKPSNR
jgi:hypothetical protein